ncbi:hypothetical protein U0038_19885 [Sphingobacterium spiritivorum]|uniref:Uncharacterized protein n=1 Tax=Sphingobacterium spiritivorum ATCC 33861 TaxID=525373 RepID=D7VKW8_SPHSI|nr:hypothetical protein [Sphingobacterium spiritivorum]EFK58241.1 hypothetical protein HMPREF0766_11637 [Sphingobacterium spiritivorum ATCC 33861]QQT37000.1 hypothetical protein I6J01_06180 [Sphingobacterium spiritivorum]WQD33768.1 hypothetical protein U0038_19885 [Sphingobacterium spiritivorum]SUJ27167.1 Uncharacterised protein [Sphingobacterium spiritivorum]
MKRYFILIILASLLSSVKAQVQQIEDFRDLYMPDPETFLTGFIPAGFVRITPAQALGVIDTFFMEKSVKKAVSNYTGTEVNYYKKGNIVMSCGVYNDSIKWHIQQDIRVQEMEGSPGTTQPVSLTEKYWNPYNGFKGSGALMVESYLWKAFQLLEVDDSKPISHRPELKLMDGWISETRTSNTLQIAYAYPSVNPMRMYPVLLAFDKGYRYKIEVRVFTVNSNRQEAVDNLKWIAKHMEIGIDLPE